MEFLSDRGATNDVVLLDDDDPESGSCLVGTADQPVVATADDRDVVPSPHANCEGVNPRDAAS